MMAKPRSREGEDVPALSVETPSKPQNADDAVEDLERRLALLGGPSPPLPTTSIADTVEELPVKAPVEIQKAPETMTIDQTPEGQQVKGGKNALLVSPVWCCSTAKTANPHQISRFFMSVFDTGPNHGGPGACQDGRTTESCSCGTGSFCGS